ncbi:MAG: hypothetical protein H0V86_01535 [Chloroflexia bacterium]|nr:hypothetical protein [Chloroflexia bacterium]
MRSSAWLAVLGSSLLGAAIFKVGTPVVRTYPSTDGSMVIKFSLSKAPGFVAYLRTGGGRSLQSGSGDASRPK